MGSLRAGGAVLVGALVPILVCSCGLPASRTRLSPMVTVPAGTFLYGPRNEPRQLPEFRIDRFETTNEEYRAYVRATGRGGFWAKITTLTPDELSKPARYVSRAEAEAYAQWVSKALPTEEEWEKAARGTDGRRYPWGDQWVTEWFSYYSHGVPPIGAVGTHPRGASPYGVEDLLGSVLEWTASDMTVSHSTQYVYSAVRGGSLYSTLPQDLVVTARNPVGVEGRYPFVGFRCVSRKG